MFKTLFVLLFSLAAHAQMPAFCDPSYATLPVQAGGRVKPLLVVAAETFRHTGGKDKINDMPAEVAFCRFSFEGLGIPSGLTLPIKVEHVEAKKLLGVPEGANTISWKELEPRLDEVRAAMVARKENDSYKKELQKILSRANIAQKLTYGALWTVPVEDGGKISWMPLVDFLTEERMNVAKDQGGNPFATVFNQGREAYVRLLGDRFMLEYTYFKANIFLWAMLLGIVTLALGLTLPSTTPVLVASGICLAIQITGLIMRVMISGRAPVTNMYETVMFSGLGAHLISFGLSIWKKERNYVMGGLAYNVLCLMMMKFADGMLDPAISPLVPVLRDNFWLSTHVTTVILSYAALALSWILANVVLVRSAFFKTPPAFLRQQTEQIYTCLKFGVVLLSIGIILGGVWADYSWGRFWGWDPKETWSLIVLLVYMAILHGRYSSWITPKRFVPLVAGAFMSVMMAWFGVNYILATGLHSYGFSEGGAVFLGSIFAAQTALLVASYLAGARKAN